MKSLIRFNWFCGASWHRVVCVRLGFSARVQSHSDSYQRIVPNSVNTRTLGSMLDVIHYVFFAKSFQKFYTFNVDLQMYSIARLNPIFIVAFNVDVFLPIFVRRQSFYIS